MLWLIGMMGSGKSTVGAALAAVTGFEFLDTDQMVEEATGSTIPALFGMGESFFRAAEIEAVATAATAGSRVVVATGGGVLLSEENQQSLRLGTTVWLSASAQTLQHRTDGELGRPLLVGGPDVLKTLLAERAPAYRKVADLIIETDGCTEAQVVQGILDKWQR